MKSDNSELDLQEKKLKNIRWYQILMTFFLILSLILMILLAVTVSRLKAQEKLRGDFDQISLVIKLTQGEENVEGEGKEIIPQNEAFNLYHGPNLSKDYYGKSLGYYLKETSPAFQINGGFLEKISIPNVELPSGNWYWNILSYSERNVNEDHSVQVGLNELFLDRVNIFVFKLTPFTRV